VVFAEVSVNSPIPSQETYTYEVPQGLSVKAGHGVYVPFGPRMLQGVVLELTESPRFEDPRPIAGLVAEAPLVSAQRLSVARWIAAHYLSPLYPAVSLMLPPGFERKPLTVIQPDVNFETFEGTLEHQAIVDQVKSKGRIELDDLKKALGLKRNASIQALVNTKVLARVYTLDRPRVAARVETLVQLAISEEEALGAANTTSPSKASREADLLERLANAGSLSLGEARSVAGRLAVINKLVSAGATNLEDSSLTLAIHPADALARASDLRTSASSRQRAAALRHLARNGGVTTLETLRRQTRVSRIVIEQLADDGLVTLVEKARERDPLEGRVFESKGTPTLTVEQAACASAIEAALVPGKNANFLLHGVTGSGKTEVYLHALAAAISQGKKAIVLVPEISLTAQTTRRFAERFPGRVAVLHSGLSAGELFDQWNGIAAGRYDVVIGARGAVFAPQPNLGLIVIDEQHEWTYKQSDQQPHYDARAVAAQLARAYGAALVAGSATPRIESFHAALEGQSRLLALDKRVVPGPPGGAPGSGPLPPVQVVDLRAELRAGNRSIFSRALTQAMGEVLAARQQVILFLNRRGSASFLLCRACGFVPRCSSCALAFSYHRAAGSLVCHGCNRRRSPIAACPSCAAPYLRPVGAGTQRVEEEAASRFPGVRVLRWDRDVTQGRNAHDRILDQFLNAEAQILVGTQMLAKGLDIPGVTLVGVLNADIGLNLPDFRAAERTFQLLTQVAGRAGRAGEGGRAIIQTYLPGHYAINAAAEHDYEIFYRAEIEQRRKLRYPPFRRLARLTYAHTGEQAALREADRVASQLRAEIRRQGLPSVEIVGPAPSFFPKRRGRYRWDILVKGERPHQLVRTLNLGNGWTVDVDPVSLT
jgi:primosomal protein N' (replication factor Y) (superfamily II helicase)